MANENNPLPGGETLNDRLRRAAAMARKAEMRQEAAEQASATVSPAQPKTDAAPEQPKYENTRPEPPVRNERPVEPPRRPYTPEPAMPPRPQMVPEPPQPERHAHRRPEREYVVTDPTQARKKAKGTAMWVSILAALLVLAIAAVVLLTLSHNKEAREQQQQIEQLQLANEQIQLANEYDALNNEFAQYENQTSLLANDSIVQKYSAARAQVEKLLQELKNEKNKSAAQIKKLQDEIGTLKGILRQYVEQINALNQENQELRTENQEVKAQNQQLSQNIQTVTANNKVLNERMTLAEKLNVTGVNLVALNKKGRNEKNVTKARQLMVTFTIPQNNSTPVGEKTIWVRITNPEGDLLSGGGSFTFEGATLAATARKSIEYAGEEIGGVTVYWDVNTTLTPGDYTVELFCDNYRLASRHFTLKK